MSTPTRDTRIALVGIGLMGSRMARRLLDAGFAVTLRDTARDKAEALIADGAQWAGSVAEAVADADVVITSLAGAAVIEQVTFGTDGIVPAARKDALLIDMSSLAPAIARETHRRLTEAGYPHHLDAPVSGGVSGAQDGTLSIMVGGAEADVERARPVFAVLGHVFHLGGEGAGQVCKLVNQAVVHITIGAVTEGLMLAASLGVDAGKVREAIRGGYCQSRIMEIHGQKMVDRDFVPGGPLEYSVKDMDMAVEMARGADLTLPLSSVVLERYRALLDSGRGRLDHCALLLAYEEANAPHRVSPGTADTLP
ncbi:NAD(P)-dependent oxidoreductase [Roseospira visakhapatnamensis]|uniref:2-hydroxy-3-oxopropionate reductase n=1 Tax=Roseospira visakhapatnamensis TaxID=390880 RepID=A0A7W6RA17_9PROT|nr:NAD(P)-dependent oxidoreductase [Roseospira visakhapatnamensis]MBB4264684.1 2-hydroxy-3-oxopropionate reductase [Roseospira visakhapatnamensis]